MFWRRELRHKKGKVDLRVRNKAGTQIQAPLQELCPCSQAVREQLSYSTGNAGSSVGMESGSSEIRDSNSSNSSDYRARLSLEVRHPLLPKMQFISRVKRNNCICIPCIM